MNDGFYIEGQWVAPAEGIALTLQSNDLTRPATLQSSYTNTFDLPNNQAIRKLTAHADQLDSASRSAYEPLKAQVISQGQILFSGFAELSRFSGNWQVTLYQQKLNLFDRLDGRSIRTAGLSRYDHPWTLERINSLAASTDGVCYLLIDYGLLSGEVLPADVLFPAVFVKTLLAQLLSEEGYTLAGSLLTDELFKRLIIPFSESEPVSHEESWRDDRKARVSRQAPADEVSRSLTGSRFFLDHVQPFNLDNQPDQGLEQGKLRNYSASSYTYVCDVPARIRVQAFQQVKVFCFQGSVEIVLSVTLNGTEVGSARFESGSNYNLIFTKLDSITLDELVSCQAGDRLQIRLLAQRQTQLGTFRIIVYNEPASSWASFTPDLTTHTGDSWSVARNLPDLSGLSLLKSLAFLLGGTWTVDDRRRLVSFTGLSAIVANDGQAVDFSNRIDTSVEPGWTPRLEPYAQTNYLTWKETDETKKAGVLVNGKMLNYGDGVILVNAPVLETDATLFEMSVAASTESAQDLPGYGSPVLVRTRTTSGYGSSLSISNQNTTPRLLLISLGDAQPVTASRLRSGSTDTERIAVNLRPCWFGKRPYPALATEPAISLSFGPLAGLTGEQVLISRQYAGLERILRRMRVLDVSMRFRPSDLANLDFGRPVRLRGVQVGSIWLTDGLYYLNKIADYQADTPCQVTLIAF